MPVAPGSAPGGTTATSAESATPSRNQLSSAQWLLISVLSGGEGTNPYPALHEIRETAPILRMPNNVIALSRYADCEEAFRHRDLGQRPEPVTSFDLGGGLDGNTLRALTWLTRTMMMSNPPDHTRLRRLVSSAFTPRHVEELRAAVIAHADRMLDEIAGQPGVDFMSALALPFPAKVMADLLGVPDSDIDFCIPPCMVLSKPLVNKEAIDRIVDATTKLRAYFTDLLAVKRRAPGNDLISRLVHSSDEHKLDDEEVMGSVVLFFGAGLETTTNLLGNGLLTLLRKPDQIELLRQRPDAIGSAVEEMLRYDAPIQVDFRTALKPTTLAGIELAEGQPVMALLGAANRDPARFTDPDRFDVTRDQGQHLSFISGIHFCLGSHLARLEARVLFSRLLERFGQIELAGEPQINADLHRRGLVRLPVTIS